MSLAHYIAPGPCTCGHEIDDHGERTDEWMQGARTVRETFAPCEKCDCDDFEEDM